MKVRLITKTSGVGEFSDRTIDEITVGIARVSSKRDDLFSEPEKLLRHCAINQHWSVFESCFLGFEIITSRAISHEIIRHKSMNFQEFSLRYSEAINFENIELREQSKNNRQSSTKVLENTYLTYAGDKALSNQNFVIQESIETLKYLYKEMLSKGVARECARFILPLATQTKIYVTGSLRSWITFLNARLHKTAQKEIREIAELIRDEFMVQCPIISKCFLSFNNAYEVHILEQIVLEKHKKLVT